MRPRPGRGRAGDRLQLGGVQRPGEAAQRLGDRRERQAFLTERHAAAAQSPHALLAGDVGELLDQPGLADPGLPPIRATPGSPPAARASSSRSSASSSVRPTKRPVMTWYAMPLSMPPPPASRRSRARAARPVSSPRRGSGRPAALARALRADPLPEAEPMPAQRTLVLCKPDAVRRGLVGEVVSRLERKGLRLAAMDLRQLDEAFAKQHYAEHEGKPFFDDLVSFITGGPLVAICAEGPDAVTAVRTLMGPTNPVTAPPGSLRGDYALEITFNLVHGSDSEASAARELALFFPELNR
jgi:nucleoside-diphosphate kinase